MNKVCNFIPLKCHAFFFLKNESYPPPPRLFEAPRYSNFAKTSPRTFIPTPPFILQWSTFYSLKILVSGRAH